MFFAFFGSQKTNAQCVETKIYETVNPSRDGSGSIVYVSGFGKTGGAASAFTGSFNRVKYRMENNVGGVLRWAEVSFDAWTGLTIAGLQIPDHINNTILQRNYSGDFITASMDYYLDIINIFLDLLNLNNS